MRTIRTTFAAMLTVLALVALQFDAQAQTRRGPSTTQSSSSSNKQVTRSSRSSSTVRPSTGTPIKSSPSVARPTTGSSVTRKPSTTVQRPTTSPATTVRPSTGTTVRPTTGTQVRPTTGTQFRPSTGTTVRPTTGTQARPSSGAVTRPATRPSNGKNPATVTRPGDRKPGGEAMRPDLRPDQPRPGHGQPPQKPVHIRPDHRPDGPRVHPRDRDFMHYSAPSYFWTGHNHCYGHRVRVLPTHVHRYVHYGVTYYCYNDIWYRPYGGYYVVCRPPFGTVLAANLIADMTWAAVRLSYYYTVANTYSTISENNQYIAEQNAIIAQNNATIAAQNAQIAASQQQAQAAYGLATQLGLVQSYAAAGSDYYYQDGVFYVMDANGQYKVIVPPAGALIETLSEDFDMVTLADGNEYYKVDETIYRVVVIEGKPYFEVLGQLYS